jgi:prepilin-type N-terminal cleavage/methylation domain-containing protein
MTNDEFTNDEWFDRRSFVIRHSSFVIARPPRLGGPTGFTLVEMLVAMAITLVMMAAVVTLFANVSNSVRNRRATIEMTGLLRHVRNTLQQDLQGATCPGATWQRPDSNHGYIELIEGIQSDQNPTALINDLVPSLSTIPRNNIGADANGDGKITPQELEVHYKSLNSLVPGGLGDHDDVLMLTVRNEHEPFVGRIPTAFDGTQLNDFADWDYETIESPLAEVVWFCVENPPDSEDPANFFGEPGMRTVYRRALLIAPWLNSYRPDDSYPATFTHGGDSFKAEPGLLRMLPDGIAVEQAIAAIIAFQDRYDLSARLEWDHNIQRWKIMANTLADLTKRENRFGHYGFLPGNPSQRIFPYAFASTGRGYSGTDDLEFVFDPEVGGGGNTRVTANFGAGGAVTFYTLRRPGSGYNVRPFAYIADAPSNGMPATAQVMMRGDETNGAIVRVVLGPVPLWGSRRGQDVVMTDVLGFDLRVYDPGAPLFQHLATGTVLTPSDPGWRGLPPDGTGGAYFHTDNMGSTTGIGSDIAAFPFVGQGAYVDMGYGYDARFSGLNPKLFFPNPRYKSSSARPSWFFEPRGLMNVYGDVLAPGYSVYDTWSFHYENNGVNEDGDEVEVNGMGIPTWQLNDGDAVGTPSVDEGINGFDDFGHYADGAVIRLGPDDVGEYETVPPYDKPLRGVQILIRTYEPDSRAIRQVRVNQHFLPE